jgi:DNA-binding NtrC family response regulator
VSGGAKEANSPASGAQKGRSRILVVGNPSEVGASLREILEPEGVLLDTLAKGEDALGVLEGDGPSPDLLIMDVVLPGRSGLELLEELGTHDGGLPLPVILVSGQATVSDAVRATRLGAFDFFEKPFSPDRVRVGVRNALRQARAEQQLRDLRGRVHGEIIAVSEPMLELMAMIRKLAPTRTRVLITGESGTGKELVARALHDESERRSGPFVKVNCAAIPQELIETELFGHERGAFTGATRRKRGLFEVADGGTIFLDEIGDMGLDAQAKVLRVLQSGELMRVGGGEAIEIDARVVAATHRDLKKQVDQGEFREDLFFRLNVVPVRVPALRERRPDIQVLAHHFIRWSCKENGLAEKAIDPRAVDLLKQHHWPGNVRELKNVIERMVVLSDEDLKVDDLPVEIRHPQDRLNQEQVAGAWLTDLLSSAGEQMVSLRDFREAVERAYILQRLRDNGWNVSRTAESLMVERTHLHRKMKLLGIQRGDG